MNDSNSLYKYNSLSVQDEAIFDYIKRLNPSFTEMQLWQSYTKRKQRILSQQLGKPVTVPNIYLYRGEGRTKTKDAIMKTIIYGGGFVAETFASAVLGMLCAAVGNPHAHQMWLGSKNARKEHKEKAWSAYCINGNILEGFAELMKMEK